MRSSSYPETLYDWERILTRALLRTDSGNADPIRSFEITPETLAMHCGLGSEHAGGAEDAFRRALRSDPYLHWCLQNGTYRTPTKEVPNCMAVLALSLLVDSLLEGEYEEKGQYRAKLAQWLDTPRVFTNLRGIATMWGELVEWLDARVEAGDPFRRLVLPTAPKSWTHIGYTRYLSFPTKRDITVLRRLIERNARAAEDARTLVLLLDPLVHSSSVSYGLDAAFHDFRTALRAGSASVDHRFWRLVMRARKLAGYTEAPAAELRVEFDEDGGRHCRLTVVGSDPSFPRDVGSAAGSVGLVGSPNLGPPVRRGVLFFRSSGLASWTALGEPPACAGPFHVAVADRHLRLASGAIAEFEQSGTWRITKEPVQLPTVNDILMRLGLLTAKMTVRTIALADGVRVGTGWLGLPRYLPVVEGADDEIRVTPVGAANDAKLTYADGALVSDGPVDGDFTISDKAGRWSRRATFVRVAEVHSRLDGAAYGLPVQEEWRATSSKPAQTCADESEWDERPYEHQDMVEALYARAKSGIGEGDAVALVGRSAGERTWDVLRTLQESSVLDARPRERWRGRVFTLGRPTLAEIAINGVPGVLVSGALPLRLEGDLRETVALRGGSAFRHFSPGSLAPPLLGAVEIGAADLAEALGWEVTPPSSLPDGVPATRLLETTVLGESYVAASGWNWSAGRFRIGAGASGPVWLVKLVHPSGRDHDLYRVTGARCRTFTSRHCAILDAHLQAGRPLFRLEGATIRRIPEEGALPIEVARALRLRTLRNGGASDEGWQYTVSPRDAQWLASLLPRLIDGAGSPAASDPALTYRRGRGPRRPIWAAGGIVT